MANKTVATNIGVDITPPNNWVTDTYYGVNADTYFGNSLYECLVAHISGVFATDFAAGKWQSKGYGPSSSPTFTNVIISDGGSIQTGLADDDLVYLKAVDNDTNTLTTVAELHGASTPTFDILAGRLTGTFNPNGQTITGYVIGTNIQAYHLNLASLAGLAYVSESYVKMNGANTFVLEAEADTRINLINDAGTGTGDIW